MSPRPPSAASRPPLVSLAACSVPPAPPGAARAPATSCGRSSACSPPTRWRAGAPARPDRRGRRTSSPSGCGATGSSRAGDSGYFQRVPYEAVTGPGRRCRCGSPAAGATDTAGGELVTDYNLIGLVRGLGPGGAGRRRWCSARTSTTWASASRSRATRSTTAPTTMPRVSRSCSPRHARSRRQPRRRTRHLPPHQRRGVRRPRHPVVPRAAHLSRSTARWPICRWRWSAARTRWRAARASSGSPATSAPPWARASPGRAPGRGRSPARLPVLRAERQHRVRDARASRPTRCRPSVSTPTITSRRTRWTGSTSHHLAAGRRRR